MLIKVRGICKSGNVNLLIHAMGKVYFVVHCKYSLFLSILLLSYGLHFEYCVVACIIVISFIFLFFTSFYVCLVVFDSNFWVKCLMVCKGHFGVTVHDRIRVRVIDISYLSVWFSFSWCLLYLSLSSICFSLLRIGNWLCFHFCISFLLPCGRCRHGFSHCYTSCGGMGSGWPVLLFGFL